MKKEIIAGAIVILLGLIPLTAETFTIEGIIETILKDIKKAAT